MKNPGTSILSMMLVNSSSIYAVNYADGHLFVQIHNSEKIYDHPGFPYSVYLEFMNASSIGQYYNHYIPGRYGYG